jgi:hypothetical protein
MNLAEMLRANWLKEHMIKVGLFQLPKHPMVKISTT